MRPQDPKQHLPEDVEEAGNKISLRQVEPEAHITKATITMLAEHKDPKKTTHEDSSRQRRDADCRQREGGTPTRRLERNEHHHRQLLRTDIHHPGSMTTNDSKRSESANQTPATHGNASTRRHRQRKMDRRDAFYKQQKRHTDSTSTEGHQASSSQPAETHQHGSRKLTVLIQISDMDLRSISTTSRITVAPSIHQRH
jgi:hypothetical protein